MKNTVLSVVFLSMVSSYAMAQDVCSVALTSNAFDRKEYTKNVNIASSKRYDLCNQQYTSIQEAQSAARKSGFNLGYKNISIDKATKFELRESKDKKNSSEIVKISDSLFCTASSEDIEAALGQHYRETVASIALNAWTECINISLQNRLWLDYEVSEDGLSFVGLLNKTVSTGALWSQITGIVIAGDGADGVTCDLGGEIFTKEKVLASPKQITETPTAVACYKDDLDKNASISIQTSGGAVDFVSLPSKTNLEEKRWSQLSDRIDALDEFAKQINRDVGSVSNTIPKRIVFGSCPGTGLGAPQRCPAGFVMVEFTRMSLPNGTAQFRCCELLLRP